MTLFGWRASLRRNKPLYAGLLIAASACSREILQRSNERASASVLAPRTSGQPAISTHKTSNSKLEPAAPSNSVAAPADAAEAWATLRLPRFFQKLTELENKTRSSHVRVLWLGDSHTAADFWTDTVRQTLTARFGAGGPGFVRVGLRDYRHARVKVEREGRFRPEPIPFACRTPQSDGIFGLGGVRVTPIVTARALLDVRPEALRGDARWQVLFNLPKGASFRVDVGPTHRLVQQEPEKAPGVSIARQSFEGGARDRFVLTGLTGMPRFYGVIVEGTEPGVVLDTLGINGARAETAIAWARDAYIAEVAQRNPDLVVVAYGTNEAFDGLRVTAYRDQFHELVGRLRAGAPEADCLIVGPPDAMGAGAVSEPRVQQITSIERESAHELGCGFVSAAELMGGEGSFLRWVHERPQLARSDRIHLTINGYVKLGELMSQSLLSEYERYKASP